MVIKVLTEKEVDFYPATITDAVGHNQGKCSLTDMLDDYNVTTIWPKGDTSSYTLEDAIKVVNENLLEKQKKPGVRIGFTNLEGSYEEWEYFTDKRNFSTTTAWRKSDSSLINEIEAVVFPVTVELRLVTDGGRDVYLTTENRSLEFTWTVYRRGIDVTEKSTILFNGSPVTGNRGTITISSSTYTIIPITVEATYQEVTGKSIREIQIVDPTYCGLVGDDWTPTPENIKSLTYKSSVGKGGNVSASFININNKRIVIAFPTYIYSDTKFLRDMHGFDYEDSFSNETVIIDGVAYYVRVLLHPTTIENFNIGYK